ncbi:hypothetical protein CDCA_CDCA03G0917 [Cyanidium caldarium]|uniref:Uncharacterized protein n=1 Tax=Cyanidium caldarium TaxID=2771 RepID=A0AAV9IRM2_CYACA|nr:hypothetical protein CDCA_CDCA03G0917 [Cyanidium caldarium]
MSNTITSDEVNYLVFRYLQECGYVHSAYAFGHESRVLQSGLDGSGIPPGALLSFLQRGVSYAEIEARVAQRGSAAGATADAAKGTDSAAVKTEAAENGLHQALEGALFAPVRLVDVHRVLASNRQRTESSGAGGGRGAGKTEAGVAIAGAPRGVPYAIQESEVTTLYGHTAEVFVIAWNPQRAYLLASGSGDATARLWAIPSGPCGRTAVAPPLELRHYGDEVPLADADAHPAPEESVTPKAHGGGAALSRDVTAVTWSPDGLRLATSSYDGIARIWSDAGLLERRLALHSGPVLSLKWNRSGTRLLTSSVDHTVAVWRAADATATCEQQFTCHRAPALDVDWQSDDTFASSGSDKMVYVCKVGDAQPLRVFYGHQDEVNSVEWDPTGTLLASGSDDCTVKVWKPIRDGTSGTEPVAAIGGGACSYLVRDYTEHTKEVYTVRWGPTANARLASASFDGTVRIWDPTASSTTSRSTALMTLARHLGPVYTVAFSPCGQYLVSGSSDRCVCVWSLREGGLLVRTFRGQGGVFEVAWNATGTKIAAALSNGTVNVFDFGS